MIEKVEGIVVRETPYKESSKIIEVFTKKYGVISLIAKGAKRIKSPLFTGTTYLSYSSFCISKKNISTLRSVDVILSFKNILKDIKILTASSYLVNLSMQVYKQNNNPDIFDILISSLTKINNLINPLGIVNIVEMKYLKYLGVEPNLDRCLMCGSDNIASLSVDSGGFLCSNCSNVRMDKKILKLIRAYYCVDINKIDKLDVKKEIMLELDKFITEYYEKHTGLFLNQKKFFLEMYKD